ncbi:DUF4174 domain-containing protein [Sphingomonas nostoxanthinifaciens]|uniref:DUF4174 domain-containing protein n=1 Tax=Sphingomonas nostoxanthinifaciens TaxID=2872652 RepID=UPI001CC20EFA|nr:DUF4174 domain-containing protein [Sphingomonas nostoxanthinifaciens]UAK25371.1 DUF4174 domain-containing protein [Sphingomonas nostoxanthinifaciens]
MKRLLLAAAIVGTAATAGTGDLRSVAGMQYHQRVLLVFAPSLRDPRLTEERKAMAAIALDAASRDLAFVQVADQAVIGAHDKAEHLRHAFKVPQPVFKALLIGKDGHVAVASDRPIDGRTLIGAIDAMPMRQEEVRRAKQGLPPPQF